MQEIARWTIDTKKKKARLKLAELHTLRVGEKNPGDWGVCSGFLRFCRERERKKERESESESEQQQKESIKNRRSQTERQRNS
jgi:hypothetical protein